jgi:intracellular septation protein A
MAREIRRASELTPMNGMAGAGLTCGVFGLFVAIGLGFWSVPFAAMAVLIAAAALAFSARGAAIARQYGNESKIARAGLFTGGLTLAFGMLGLVFG